ncbi:MAG: uracil-DNA glycosylase [Bacteroidota bacterium]
MSSVQIEAGWKAALKNEWEKPYFQRLKEFLRAEKTASQRIFPPGKLIFHAFDRTSFEQVKAVIIGQDPYHGPGQAMGLSFSVPRGVRIPPSLRNIYKEINDDLGLPIPAHGDLTHWADQGVLMLNSILTVRASQAGSHRGKGWEQFTSAAINVLNRDKEGLVFLLWGKYAQEKGAIIDPSRHKVLKAPHPSPLARGFNGCRHFSQANEYLVSLGKEPIDWGVR